MEMGVSREKQVSPGGGRQGMAQLNNDSEEYDEDAAWGDVRRAKEQIRRPDAESAGREEKTIHKIINPTEVSIKDGNQKTYDAATLLQHYKDK